ncbi:MAG: hypothetical protein EOO10_23660, partial [Chitinophagaceae bacterium]
MTLPFPSVLLRASCFCFLFIVMAMASLAQAPIITSFTPGSGTSNTWVEIKGQNFTGATAVKFGGTSALFFGTRSDTSIYAVVDTGSSGVVTVQTAKGTGFKAGFRFIYTPTIDSFAPAMAGNGDTVTIYGHHFSDVQEVYFGDSAAVSFAIVADTLIKAVVGVGSSGDILLMAADTYGWFPGFIHTAPGITSFSPTRGNAGTLVTLKGSRFTG